MEQRESGGSNIVIGQPVTLEKVLSARAMRQQMTIAEEKLWQMLRGSRGGANFRRQQIIDGYIADFYCHQARLVVEADGAFHNAEYDAERDRIFSSRGLMVLRFSNDQVMFDLPAVLNVIRQTLIARLKDV